MQCIAANCRHDSQEEAGRVICVEPDNDGWICEPCWDFMVDGGVCSLTPNELKEIHLDKLKEKYGDKYSRSELSQFLYYYGIPPSPLVSWCPKNINKCIVAHCKHNHSNSEGRVICVEPDNDGWICELCWNFLINGHSKEKQVSDARMIAAMTEYIRCD